MELIGYAIVQKNDADNTIELKLLKLPVQTHDDIFNYIKYKLILENTRKEELFWE